MKTLVPCLLLAFLGALSLAQVPADLVLVNGKIWTVNPARLPTRQLIDGATPGNPVFINRLDGHILSERP